MKKATEKIIIVLTLIYIFLLIVFSKEISVYVFNAIKNCVTLIIPSLYIFMIVSDFIITSNIYVFLSKPFSFAARYIFKIPQQFFPIYIISNIGGYPIGAKLISDMLNDNKIDRKTAEDMLNYCYFSGPAFIIGIVGTGIYSNIKIGLIVFISIFISNLIIAVITGLSRDIPKPHTYNAEIDISFNKFIKSIYSGGKSIFNICAIIVFFSSLICIMENCGIVSTIAGILDKYSGLDYADGVAAVKSFIEISNISLFKAEIQQLPLITALLSFGGLCIILQVKSIAENIPLNHFLIFRILAMLLSYCICKLIYFISHDFLSSVYSPAHISNSQNSPIMTLFLLIMTILILLKFSIEKKRKI